MRIIIIGGGKLGYYIAANMLDRDYEVKLIEKVKEKCRSLANELDVEVVYGDGTEIEILASAGVSRADCFIAVTGSDQDNLVACQLAKKKFLIKKVISRVNNPRNLEAFHKLGIKNTVSSTDIITHLIEQEVEVAGMRLLATLNRGKAAICTITIPRNAKVHNVNLRDLPLPKSSLIVSILRNKDLIIPQGDTIIYSGDEIVAICEGTSQRKLMKMLSEVD